jgi:hypothetical protein
VRIKPQGGRNNKPKVDYREVLNPEQFGLFSRLRDKCGKDLVGVLNEMETANEK